MVGEGGIHAGVCCWGVQPDLRARMEANCKLVAQGRMRK
jgi:hypothetical protein